jgi:hypothetical protein
LRIAGDFSVRRLIGGAATVLMLSVSANSAPSVQGFYRVDPFYDLHSFYRQYPYTQFGYPNYHWNYYPRYRHYPNCDFVWPKATAKHKASQRGIWTCS